ncbi:OPT oligopeptide transporter protein-domain-containing protein [Plectosphaerella plurivora]|uniref:OPT oligopeptide transporter protein-domain-containing protein n=1 Tax=Plectosphaerella plurivora TaxID=936078 RepID=A0A9P8V2K6_9PEZI|nr:OPT oligopeptide transporter protein-domain-containing protein [Plectosphaerella plurivora]
MSEKRQSEVAAAPGDVAIDLDDRATEKSPNLPHDEKSITNGTAEIIDTFKPLEGVVPYDGRRILTVRALVTGAILGSTIACSNLYLGLKTGFGADATLFASIFGFAICKGLEKSKIPFLSGHFGPHENNIIQATALGCIGIGFLFMSGVPAMYQLHLMSSLPQSDYARLLSLTFSAGFWALGFAAPLRKVFILRLARHLSLVFPTGTASAVTIQALHSAASAGADRSKENIRTIACSFSFSLVWSIATSYAPGILYTWNPLWWIYKWGGTGVITAVNWGWISWQWSPSVIGMGLLIDLNASMSYLFGSILSWGIIGPILVATGEATGVSASAKYPDFVTYNAFIRDQLAITPSPRYWMLWPGVFTMLGVSVAVILLESKSFAQMTKYATASLVDRFRSRSASSDDKVSLAPLAPGEIPDPCPPQYQIRWWEWTSVSVVAFIFTMVALKYVFGVPPALNLLNMFLGIMWSLVAIQVFGAAGVSPIGTVAKGSQFVLGAITRPGMDGSVASYNSAATVNLAGATVSAAAAQQSAELCQDFPQWYAQMFGTLVAAFVTPALFSLFARAYPCIINAEALTCPFALPAVTGWRIVTEAILAPKFPIVQSSWIFSVIFASLGIASIVLKRWLIVHPTLSHLQIWVPNMALVGLAMTIPGSTVTTTLAIGSVASHIWRKRWPASHGRFMYAIAAGGIAGEGIGNVIMSGLQIGEVAGPTYYGSMVGCVADMC